MVHPSSWVQSGHTSLPTLTIRRRLSRSLAKLSKPALDRLNAKPESYPNVIILARGRASGRRCSNQQILDSGCVHVFFAWPFKPWTATMLGIQLDQLFDYERGWCVYTPRQSSTMSQQPQRCYSTGRGQKAQPIGIPCLEHTYSPLSLLPPADLELPRKTTS